MENSVQKSKKHPKIMQKPDKLIKKASNREILQVIIKKQERQDEKLDVLGEKVAKIDQRFVDYVEHHNKSEGQASSHRKEEKDDRKWMVATAVSVTLFIIKLLWDAWPR